MLGHFPGWEWSSVSSRFGTLILPVRPFRSLPYQGTLIVEVPTVWPEWLFTTELRRLSAPHLRAWAYWEYGVQVRAHHEYPDKSICAHKPGEWRLGRDRILAYASFCVLWMAKALHLQLLGRWPGLQHYPAHVRVRRAAYDEFCGCGAKARYGSCHRAFDEARTPADRAWELYLAERAYLHEIRMRGWPPSPPIIQAPST